MIVEQPLDIVFVVYYVSYLYKVHSVRILERKTMNAIHAIHARHLLILIDAVSEDRFYIYLFSPQYVWWFQEKYSV